MTARDSDAWWSPVPGGAPEGTDAGGSSWDPRWPAPAAGPAGGLTHPGAPAGPAAYGSPNPPRASRRPWRRRLLLIGVGVLVLAVAAVVTVRLVVGGTKVLYDSARTLSIVVPRTWYDNTGEPGSDPDVPPVVAASNLWQSQRVEVDRYGVDAGDTLASFHAEGVDSECAQWTCATRVGPERMSVAGHEALEQVVTHPADADGGATTSLTLTVWLDDRAVEVYATATASGATAPDPELLRRVAASLQLL